MFMDLSSEMIHSLLPVYMVSVLGLNALEVGLIEGFAESTAAITKLFAGVVSDWIGRRKPLVLFGYALAALTKPLFPLATGAGAVFIARFLDRIGKGIRGAPRDALIADLTPEPMRGAAYGLRQSMDTVGAFVGPVLAMALMALFSGNFRPVFWVAVIPAMVAVALVVLGVDEADEKATGVRRFPFRRAEVGRLGSTYWMVVIFAAILTLARFSEAFLLLRAADVGLAAKNVPAVLVVMNVVYAVSAYPFGRLADRYSRIWLLGFGTIALIASDLFLAAAGAPWPVFAGSALWGLHMGATQGLLTTILAAAVPANLRATAFGLYGLITGGTILGASALAGFLWTAFGPAWTFRAGAVLSVVALLGFLTQVKPRAGRRRGSIKQ